SALRAAHARGSRDPCPAGPAERSVRMILTLLLLPLLAGVLVSLAGNSLLARLMALAASIATLVVAFMTAPGSLIDLPWIPQAGVGFSLAFEGAGRVLVTTAAFVLVPTLWYAGGRVTHRTGVFMGLIL